MIFVGQLHTSAPNNAKGKASVGHLPLAAQDVFS